MTSRLHQPALFPPPPLSVDRALGMWEVLALRAKRPEAGAAFEALHQVLCESGVVADLTLVVAAGRRGALRAWLGAQAPDGLEPPFTEIGRVFGVTAPWLELGPLQVNQPLGRLDARCGAVFRFATAEILTGVRSSRSALLSYLAATPNPWQLTVTAGLVPAAVAADEVGAGVGVSLLGSGSDLSLAGPLLTLDLSRDEPVRADPHLLDAPSLDRVCELARWGIAPSRGPVPRSVIADLLSLPAGCAGAWSAPAAEPGLTFERRFAWPDF